jgi:hypothetical protein
MSTFVVTSDNQVIDSVNYLLSNLGQVGNVGNTTIPTGTLIGNTTTGLVSTYNYGGGVPYSYLYQYLNLRYANNATGTSGFSTVPTNSDYFGVYNSITSTASSVPAAYTWFQVAGGFGTTKTIFYSTQGGRQVQLVPANVAPSSSFIQSTANVAIDLDVVTTAAGTPGERGPIAMAYVVTPATPVGASDLQLTAWWEAARDSLTPPIGTGLTPVVGDTGTFIYGAGVGTPSVTYEYNGSGWTSVVQQVISGNVLVANSTPGTAITTASITGNRIAANTITGNTIQVSTITGNLIAANTITGNTIQVSTITGNLVAANTITATNIQTSTITANQIAANTITATNIQTSTITANQIAANTITAGQIATNTITANQIAANTITATQISTSFLYTGNIVSFGANIGNNSSTGYWLQYNTGNARFGGNVNIGNSLTIGANASIGGNLAVSGLITAGNLNSNTVATITIVPNAVTSSGAFSTGNDLFVANAVSGTVYTIPAVTITTADSNQQVIVWLTAGWELRLRNNGSSATAFGTLSGRLNRYDATVGGPGLTLDSFSTNFTRTMPTAGVDYSTYISNQSWPVVIDAPASAGTYVYAFAVSVQYSFTSGSFTGGLRLFNQNISTSQVSENTIVALGLKR